MDNTREKLIELLDQTVAECMPSECIDEIADHLIANGVTIRKWIPVSERLPEEGKWVLCLKNGRWHWLAIWNPKEWTDGEFWEEETVVTHWMPLPEPPKEGE